METYYTAQANGDGFYQVPGSDTARNEGDVVQRIIYWKAGAFAAINSGGFTEVTLDDDSTYTELLAAIDDILNANGAPITIYSTRQELTPSAAILEGYTDDLVGAFASALLVPDYEGSCIRIRRSGDNAETDIGFNGTDLDRDAIAAFCSPGDGFVKTWYDQSGGGNDATQTSTSLQPKIYDASTGVITQNGKPAAYWDGVNDYLQTSYDNANDYTAFWVQVSISDTIGQVIGRGTSGARHVAGWGPSNNVFHYRGGATSTNISASSGQYIGYTLSQPLSADSRVGYNGTTGGTSTTIGTDQLVDMVIGAERSSFTNYGNSHIQAVIIYAGDKSADRTAIETAINSYFNIYS
jgi:hypothetical protein